MLTVLKSLLGAMKPRSPKTLEYEAKLQPPPGGAGAGELEYSVWADGARLLKIELRLPHSGDAEVFVRGARIGTVRIVHGRGDHGFATQLGHDVPECGIGDAVAVYLDGGLALSGAFIDDF